MDETKLAEEVGREIKRIGDDLKGLRDGVQKDLHDARALVAEGKSASDAAVKAATESMLAKLEALEAAQKKGLNELSAAMNRTPRFAGAGGPEVKTAEAALEFKRHGLSSRGELKAGEEVELKDGELEAFKAYTKGFRKVLVKDERLWTQDEVKALTTGNDPTGGYLVPPTLSSRILSKVYESSPLRQLATVETIGTDRIEYPVDEDEVSANWVGEEQTRSETDTPDVGVQVIQVHEMAAEPKATQKMLEDSGMDIESWLARKLAEYFARAEATAFVTGNGLKKPRGILSYPAGTNRYQVEQIATGDANLVTADSIKKMPYQLMEEYHSGASWLMKRSTLGVVSVMKDGNGQYLWVPGLREGTTSTLVGYPVRMANDFPAVAANALVAAFGDFRTCYTIVDRLGIVTVRDALTSKPWVKFYTRKRVGADVVNFQGYKLLKVSA